MSNNVLVIDAGNSLIKAKSAGAEVSFTHAIHRMTDAEWDRIVMHSHDKLPVGYVKVNGVPYAVGRMAETRAVLTKLKGAARYTKDYYGVFVALALSQVYNRGGDVMVFCSHAPRDVEYTNDMLKAAIGTYSIETGGKEIAFRVVGGTTFDEPVGGLMNILLSEDGRAYARNDLNGGDTLVIDIGGVTTDFLSMSDGQIDYQIVESRPVGIQQIERDFERSLRNAFAVELKNTPDLPIKRIRNAIQTGSINIAGVERKCDDLATESSNVMLNEIANVYQDVAGGPGRWDSIVLTGGGSALLYNRLTRDVLGHGHVVMADKDLENMHLANVRGGLKLWRFYQSEGLL